MIHVVPLKSRNGLKPTTIRSYDLTLVSPEALPLASFFLHQYHAPVSSFDELLRGTKKSLPQIQPGNSYRCLAVGIDLSLMGYREGEFVDGLFFQDALDDRNHVDPVLILGLP
jgi:hypothetical protein